MLKMKFLLALLATIANVVVHADETNSTTQSLESVDYVNEDRIFGGGGALDKYPYIAGLRKTSRDNSYCGGSLIAPGWILTAAHCPDPGYISVGSRWNTHVPIGGKRVKVKSVIRHPNWNNVWIKGFDFMLVQLEEPVSEYRPVALSRDIPPTGISSLALGWGQSEAGKYSKVLLKANLEIVANSLCAMQLAIAVKDDTTEQYRRLVNRLDKSMICGDAENKDVDDGDSGGPLIVASHHQDVLVGVTSWAHTDKSKRFPSVFARVSAAYEFIYRNVPDAQWISTKDAP
jgi:trypsin